MDSSLPKPSDQNQEEADIELLRSILLEPQAIKLSDLKDRLTALEDRLGNTNQRTADTSEVLAEAVASRRLADDKLGLALKPIVVDQFRMTSREEPELMAEALFPILGPAVRKMIVNIISPDKKNQQRGYRVEQLFVMDKATGLPVCHVASELAATQDADMVSGMLSAIQSFVHEAFETDELDGLNTLRLGELSVWIEWGPHALLAAVVRGVPPKNLRDAMEIKIEQIHAGFNAQLQSYEGDASVFEPLKPDLLEFLDSHDGSLKNRLKNLPTKTKKNLTIFGLAFVLFFVWFVQGIYLSARWAEFVAKVESEPGIIVTEQIGSRGNYKLSGLRDPLAADLAYLLDQSSFDPKNIEFNFEPYQAIDANFILIRAKKLLRPPKTIGLDFQGSSLLVSGVANSEWIEEARDIVRAIAGVDSSRFDVLVIE